MLEAVMESAPVNENVGHTLLIDAAYHLYAEEPHGWAETIHDAMSNGWPWPENLLITFALSLSKSHTMYGLRTGAIVSIHPDQAVTDRIARVMGVTGRQTWSAAPRVSQYTVSELHASDEGGAASRGPDNNLENEAKRIISLLPKIKPGKENGVRVRVPFSIPITFKLQ